MIGSQVPDIEVEAFHDEATKKVNLRDYKGQWLIVVFYPADFTFVCPTELEELANLYDQFKQEGAEIASVSTDTVFVHKAWHDHSEAIKKIRYPMLADPTGKLCKAFGTYLDDEGLALRGSLRSCETLPLQGLIPPLALTVSVSPSCFRATRNPLRLSP